MPPLLSDLLVLNTSLNKNHEVLLKAKKKRKKNYFNVYGIRPQGRDSEALHPDVLFVDIFPKGINIFLSVRLWLC